MEGAYSGFSSKSRSFGCSWHIFCQWCLAVLARCVGLGRDGIGTSTSWSRRRSRLLSGIRCSGHPLPMLLESCGPASSLALPVGSAATALGWRLLCSASQSLGLSRSCDKCSSHINEYASKATTIWTIFDKDKTNYLHGPCVSNSVKQTKVRSRILPYTLHHLSLLIISHHCDMKYTCYIGHLYLTSMSDNCMKCCFFSLKPLKYSLPNSRWVSSGT